MRILVVEDDDKAAAFLKQGLEEEGYDVDVAPDGEEGAHLGHVNPYDLIVLDIQLPRRSGLELSRELRREGVEAPILMLTGRDSTEDIVRGLDAGADDYLTKPLAFDELLARVRALVRRRSTGVAGVLRRLRWLAGSGSSGCWATVGRWRSPSDSWRLRESRPRPAWSC